MPILKNPRHEAFAQALARREPACKAYVSAGYEYNEGNCIRLKGNERIIERLNELLRSTEADTVLTIRERREICTEVARDKYVEPHVRVNATLAEAKHAGELVEKVALDARVKTTPEQVADAVRRSPALRDLALPGNLGNS